MTDVRGGYLCPHCPQQPAKAQHREFVQSLLDQHIRRHHPTQEKRP